ncbi:MAG: flagellar motor protein MotB, partial [Elusimicrobiota bacterium]
MMERYSGNNNIDSTEDQESIHKHPLWMIIYTDMITNLMIFFLLSYCLTWLSTEDREIAAKSFQEAYTSRRVAPEVKEED